MARIIKSEKKGLKPFKIELDIDTVDKLRAIKQLTGYLGDVSDALLEHSYGCPDNIHSDLQGLFGNGELYCQLEKKLNDL